MFMKEIPIKKDYSEQKNEKKRREREGEAYYLCQCAVQKLFSRHLPALQLCRADYLS